MAAALGLCLFYFANVEEEDEDGEEEDFDEDEDDEEDEEEVGEEDDEEVSGEDEVNKKNCRKFHYFYLFVCLFIYLFIS